jgi:Ca-activated chloride channel family protein
MSAFLISWFAHPQALALLALLPTLGLLLTWARRRRRQNLDQFGGGRAVAGLLSLRPAARRWQTLALFAGLVLLILGIAGPQWGNERLPTSSARGDIMVVLDVSRSMFAEQPSRLERALRSLDSLAATLDTSGGRRIGLVAFAGQPRLWFPLTADFDHFRFALRQIQRDELPPSLRPNAEQGDLSGTRIGAALKLAVSTLDLPRSDQAIILLSDGDDPAGDEEWRQGAQAAHARKLPIHVVAIGDPVGEHSIPYRGDVLHYQGKVVKSKVNEDVLKEIARSTDGLYLPAPSGQLPLGPLLIGRLSLVGGAGASDDKSSRLLVRRPRHAWFLWPALVLLACSVVISERPRAAWMRWRGLGRVAVAAGVLVFVSAAPPPQIDDWIRQGNAAFERGEFEEALGWYDKAEVRTVDPGLVAFNKAAAYFRLGRFREADLHYQRALEDGQIQSERRVRAWFDLGNARVKQAGEDHAALLESAIAAYRACLADSATTPALAKDVRHNLELASLLWAKARIKHKDDPSNTPDSQDPKKNKTPKNGKDPKGNGEGNGEDDPKGSGKNGNGLRDKNGKKGNQAAQGPLQVLPDDNQLTPLSPQETEAHLERLADRIERDRRAFWSQRTPPVGNIKDW